MIEVKNLTKRYGGHAAVDNISFSVDREGVYGFLGPNGAGKSTTMNILTGYLAPTSGDVSIDGHDILEEPEAAKKSIGYLPEMPPLYTDMTVGEYLNFAAELKKIPKDQVKQSVTSVMEETDITNMQNRLIKNLSKGYRQRTGLAQALLGDPKILILDEPMVGLDPKQIVEIRELIRGLGKNHVVILSSHILSEVQEICDTIIIISHGKLVAIDTPEKLEHYMSGSGILQLTVRGTKTAVERALASLSGIEKYEVRDSEEQGACSAEITAKEGQDVREALFYLFAEKKLPLLRMQLEKASLEKVFLELTSQPETDTTIRPKKKRGRKGRVKVSLDLGEVEEDDDEKEIAAQIAQTAGGESQEESGPAETGAGDASGSAAESAAGNSEGSAAESAGEAAENAAPANDGKEED